MKNVAHLLAEKLPKNQRTEITTGQSFRMGFGLELAYLYR